MNEIIINNLRRIMQEKGINSSFRFVKLGISSQLVDRVLKHGNPTVKTLQRLSQALEINITEFFRE